MNIICKDCNKIFTCNCKKEFPKGWLIRNTYTHYSSSIDGKEVIPYTEHGEIIIEWCRDIAPFHQQTRFTRIKLQDLEGEILDRGYWGDKLSAEEMDKNNLLK